MLKIPWMGPPAPEAPDEKKEPLLPLRASRTHGTEYDPLYRDARLHKPLSEVLRGAVQSNELIDLAKCVSRLRRSVHAEKAGFVGADDVAPWAWRELKIDAAKAMLAALKSDDPEKWMASGAPVGMFAALTTNQKYMGQANHLANVLYSHEIVNGMTDQVIKEERVIFLNVSPNGAPVVEYAFLSRGLHVAKNYGCIESDTVGESGSVKSGSPDVHRFVLGETVADHRSGMYSVRSSPRFTDAVRRMACALCEDVTVEQLRDEMPNVQAWKVLSAYPPIDWPALCKEGQVRELGPLAWVRFYIARNLTAHGVCYVLFLAGAGFCLGFYCGRTVNVVVVEEAASLAVSGGLLQLSEASSGAFPDGSFMDEMVGNVSVGDVFAKSILVSIAYVCAIPSLMMLAGACCGVHGVVTIAYLNLVAHAAFAVLAAYGVVAGVVGWDHVSTDGALCVSGMAGVVVTFSVAFLGALVIRSVVNATATV